jgi:hypothetical protein
MPGLFSSPKTPKMQPVPPPAPIPQTGSDSEDAAMRAAKSRAGFQKTILAGNLQPPATKKQLLGGP